MGRSSWTREEGLTSACVVAIPSAPSPFLADAVTIPESDRWRPGAAVDLQLALQNTTPSLGTTRALVRRFVPFTEPAYDASFAGSGPTSLWRVVSLPRLPMPAQPHMPSMVGEPGAPSGYAPSLADALGDRPPSRHEGSHTLGRRSCDRVLGGSTLLIWS